MSVYLHLFHGRDTVDQDMDDWGYDGPVIGPLEYVHTTYKNDIKFACSEAVARKFFGLEEVYQFSHLSEGRIVLANDLVPYKGKFYGDWSVFGANKVKTADDGALVAL